MALIGIPEAALRMGITHGGARAALKNAAVTLVKINERALAVEEAEVQKYIEERGGVVRVGRPRKTKQDFEKPRRGPKPKTDWEQL
jgi:hypothetical protein